MYFLSVGPLQVISLYFYCLHLATGESWLSGLIFPYLLSSLLDLPVGVYWVFLTEFYDEIQIVFWKFVVSDELHQKHRWISDSDMLEFLPAHPMGFQRLQSNRVVQSLTFWQTLSCQCPGAGFPVSAESLPYTHEPQELWISFPGEIWSLGSSFSAEILQHAVVPNMMWGSQEPQEHHLCLRAALPS